jgi:two-component system, cell cycle sensor histidine kinase and response regulator CckA
MHWAGAFWSGFHTAAVGMALVDRDFELVEANRALAGLLARPARELAGTDVTGLADPRDVDALRRLLEAALRDDPVGPGLEITLASGLEGPVRAVVSASPVPDEGGRATGLLLHVLDVTARRMAEDALRASEERFRLLVDNMEEYAVFMLDPDGRVASWNAGAQRLIGYDHDEAVGRHFHTFFTAEDQAAQLPEQILASARAHGSARSEGWRPRKDGSQLWAESTVTALVGEDGAPQGFGAVTHDVTKRRRAEDELHQAQKLEALARLAGGVAHDFNNLLAAILGYGEVLGERVVNDPEARSEVQQIVGAAGRARDLVNQLLAFSRKQGFDRRPLDLAAVVAELEPMLRRLLGDRVELETRLVAEGAQVVADRGQVEQVLMNLVANAQDALPDGGRVTVEVREARAEECAGMEAPGGGLALSVIDTGVGMDAATAECALDPFFTTKEAGPGAGLGLSTVYGIVRQSGGTVLIDSAPGEGTTVTVLMPLAAPAPAVGSKPPPTPPRRPARAAVDASVLLVEDEEPVRAMLELVLRNRGFTVLTATDGVEALEAARRHDEPIDLVVTDVSMPRLNGTELVAKLRQEEIVSKTIYISGFTAQALEIDPDERFLQKPFSLVELLDTADDLLS